MFNIQELEAKIDSLLSDFYKRRIDKITTLKLREALSRKNPYLYKTVGVQQASEIVKEILIAYMSSSDEGIFGDAFFEPLAEFVCSGHVSDAEGIDVIVENDTIYKAYAIKSGINVFNASSRKKQSDNFKTLRKRVNKRGKVFDAIVGYGYGQKNTMGGNTEFREIAGQVFWEDLTGDPNFYLKIIELIKDKPQKHLPKYNQAFNAAVNRFTGEFIKEFCYENGFINWEKLVRFNSGKKCTKLTVTPKTKTLELGEQQQLNILATFGEDQQINVVDSNEISYSMDIEEVFEIDDNRIITVKTGAKPGSQVKLIVKCFGRQNTVTLKVKKISKEKQKNNIS